MSSSVYNDMIHCTYFVWKHLTGCVLEHLQIITLSAFMIHSLIHDFSAKHQVTYLKGIFLIKITTLQLFFVFFFQHLNDRHYHE